MSTDNDRPNRLDDGAGQQTPENASTTPVKFVGPRTTGSVWGDVKEAVKLLSFDDFSHVGEIPCMRRSLLTGIASGVGMGTIRGLSVGVLVGANWAVGTFMAVSLGTWQICRSNLANEQRQMQKVVEQLPKRVLKKDDESGKPSPAS